MRVLALVLLLACSGSSRADGIFKIYQNTPIHRVLLELAVEAHQDVLISDQVRGLVTLRLQGESAGVALAGVLRTHGAKLERVGDVGVVLPESAQAVSGSVHDFDAWRPELERHKVTLHLTLASLPQLLGLLTRELPWTLVVKPPAGARISAHVSERALGSVLPALAVASGLSFEVRPQSVVFFVGARIR